jgi:hypothetical protein
MLQFATRRGNVVVLARNVTTRSSNGTFFTRQFHQRKQTHRNERGSMRRTLRNVGMFLCTRGLLWPLMHHMHKSAPRSAAKHEE